jgi:virulence-associated protein VapD
MHQRPRAPITPSPLATFGAPRRGHNSGTRFRPSMYSIVFDMDTTALEASYQNASWQNAYNDIARVLGRHGFTRQQGVYFGDDTVDAVRCVIAVQDLTRSFVWFSASVRDVRMLRIEDSNDLMPAVASARPDPS